LKLIVAFIYTNFRTSIVDDYGVQQTDGYTARPSSEKLILRFDLWHGEKLFDINKRTRGSTIV
jgi:hypothetical protein